MSSHVSLKNEGFSPPLYSNYFLNETGPLLSAQQILERLKSEAAKKSQKKEPIFTNKSTKNPYEDRFIGVLIRCTHCQINSEFIVKGRSLENLYKTEKKISFTDPSYQKHKITHSGVFRITDEGEGVYSTKRLFGHIHGENI